MFTKWKFFLITSLSDNEISKHWQTNSDIDYKNKCLRFMLAILWQNRVNYSNVIIIKPIRELDIWNMSRCM